MVADKTHYSSHRMTKSRKGEVLAKKEQKMYMMIRSVWFVFYSRKIDCSDKREYIQAKAAKIKLIF